MYTMVWTNTVIVLAKDMQHRKCSSTAFVLCVGVSIYSAPVFLVIFRTLIHTNSNVTCFEGHSQIFVTKQSNTRFTEAYTQTFMLRIDFVYKISETACFI